MADRFWSYNGDMRNTHATAEEARAECQRALDDYRDIAGDEGWQEVVESIAWGPIAERVVETYRDEHAKNCDRGDGCSCAQCFDEYIDYELRPVEDEIPEPVEPSAVRTLAGTVTHSIRPGIEVDELPVAGLASPVVQIEGGIAGATVCLGCLTGAASVDEDGLCTMCGGVVVVVDGPIGPEASREAVREAFDAAEEAAVRETRARSAAELQRAREAWAVERAVLEASLLEAQLEIKALRGEPEGAVGEGWEFDLHMWSRQVGPRRGYAWIDRSWAVDSPAGYGRGIAPTLREAMRAADRWTP